MFDRLANGWALAKQSFHVLTLDKELLLFPLISGIACILVFASFAVPLWFTGYGEVLLADDQAQQLPQNPIAYVLLFAFYFANYFVIVFFNAALVACAVIRFRGGNPTLGDGLGAAMDRLPQIAGWALVAATVGLILRAIESRSERVGQIVAGLLGMAWSIVTYFVVPVLVVERVGPIGAMKRSTSILRKTWGEALSANLGIGFFVFLASLPGMALLIGGAVIVGGVNGVLGAVLIAIGIAWLLIVSLVSSALNAILWAALYLFAATDTVPQQFDANLLHDAFRTR